MRWILSLLLFCSADLALAEYRVFLLEIRHVDKGTSREVISTLDHYQYPEYHPLSPRELVLIKDHWMCYGRTVGYAEPCPAPTLEAPSEVGLGLPRMPANAP